MNVMENIYINFDLKTSQNAMMGLDIKQYFIKITLYTPVQTADKVHYSQSELLFFSLFFFQSVFCSYHSSN